METIMLVIIVGAFAVFLLGVGYADVIAGARAITYEEEKAAHRDSTPARAAKPADIRQAA